MPCAHLRLRPSAPAAMRQAYPPAVARARARDMLPRCRCRCRAADAAHAARPPQQAEPRCTPGRILPSSGRASRSHFSPRHAQRKPGHPVNTDANEWHKIRSVFTGSPAFAGDDDPVWSAGTSNSPEPFTMSITRRAFTASALSLLANPASAQQLDKVSFGTNWVAEAEHGGFYQAVADGTYKKYGLDVSIVPGGSQVNNRMLLLAGKIDFFMSANCLQSFDAVAQNIPVIAISAIFQKDPQVLLAHSGAAERFEDLKKLTLFISSEGLQSYYKWMVAEIAITGMFCATASKLCRQFAL